LFVAHRLQGEHNLMHAAVVSAFNVPPAYTTFPDPVAAQGEQPVTITAAGLHPITKALANGTHYGSTAELPFIPGVDGVGRLQDGSRIFFGISRSPYGTFAERGLAANWMCIPLPEGLDDATAAGIANPAMSSWAALNGRAKFVAGESVLILGATGVAGRLAIQIAKRLGARRVIAAGRNAPVETLTKLGADAVISLTQDHDPLVAAFRTEYAEAGVDVVLDYLWGSPAESLLEAISQKGLRKAASRVRYVQIGESAGAAIHLKAATLRSSGLELLGSGFGSASLDQLRAAVTECFKVAAMNPFVFNIKKAPLSEVEALWNTQEEGTRIVFQP
jgi:NADPH:quinone reductase-like Zn-dependent oxidoreductase